MNAICLIVDGWHWGFVGCYGNSWIDTPAMDRLACESLVLDQALVDTPDLARAYRSLWRGLHALAPAAAESAQAGLLGDLAAVGVHRVLVSDEAAVTAHRLAEGFDEIVQVPAALDEPPGKHGPPGEHLAETATARTLAAAADWLATAAAPFLLWVHLQGFVASWDAPLAYRRRYATDEHVPLYLQAAPPAGKLADDTDPDLLVGMRWAYAGQATLLDDCLAAFLEGWLAAPAAAETLLLLGSLRGFPLGTHGWLGGGPAAEGLAAAPLYSELVQVPLMVRHPQGQGAMSRSAALVQPADIPATLAEWWGLAPLRGALRGQSLLPLLADDAPPHRDRACVVGLNERALRTAAWYLRQPAPAGDASSEDLVPRAELYVKPDDRWEVNDVARLCPEVVAGLAQALDEFAAAEAGAELAPLDERLVSPIA